MNDAPERIYLQWGEPDVPGGPPPDLWDVSWCEDRTEASDVAYVRADRIAALERQRDVLVNTLDSLSVHSTHLEPCPGWVCVPQVEWDAAFMAWGQALARAALEGTIRSQKEECEHCGGKVTDHRNGCPGCGAPQCCQTCCDEANRAALGADAERGGTT